MNPNDENLVQICITYDQVQESLIAGALEDAGLHYVIQNFDDAVFTGVSEPDHGHSRIYVLEHEYEQAKEIVDESQIQKE